MMKQISVCLVFLLIAVTACNKDDDTPAVTVPSGTASAVLDGAGYSVSDTKLTVTVGSASDTLNAIVLTGDDNSVINLYFSGESTDTWSLTQSGDYRATYTDTLGNVYKSISGEITVTKYNNDSSITWVNGSFKFDGELFSDKPLIKITSGTFKDVSDY